MVLEGDINWEQVGRSMPVISVAVGALSSLVGVDSGELISPMFLQMGLLPQVRQACCSNSLRIVIDPDVAGCGCNDRNAECVCDHSEYFGVRCTLSFSIYTQL